MWIPWTSSLPLHKGDQWKRDVLFVWQKGKKKTSQKLCTQDEDVKSWENQTETTGFRAKAEYSSPLGITIFKVQQTSLKTQYALSNWRRKFHSELVICRFVSGVSTMVSGNSKFLAGHERAMLDIVTWTLELCCSSTCWLQHGSSSSRREHDSLQQSCFHRSQEKAVSTMD